MRAAEHIEELRPVVPEIVGDAPHVADLLVKLRLFRERRSGREAQHHITAAGMQRLAQHYKLGFLVRELAADVVDLDEINTPALVKLENAVIVLAGTLLFGVNAVHVSVPLAYAGGLGNLTCGSGRTLDCGIAVNRLAWNSAHDMNAEFKPQRVYVFG